MLKWAAYIHGSATDGFVLPASGSKRVQKILVLDAAGNLGLVARLKQQLRIRCEMLAQIWRQILSSAAFDSFLSHVSQGYSLMDQGGG